MLVKDGLPVSPNLPTEAGLHRWPAPVCAALVSAIAIAMAALFLTTYPLPLGNPAPHGIPIAVVGDQAAHAATMQAVSQVAGEPSFLTYQALAAAQDAVDWQQGYAALDLTTAPPTLYVASAAGASGARALTRVATIDLDVRVVDTHPRGANDPNGVDFFSLILGTTILGFVTAFQVWANAAPLSLRGWCGFVLAHDVVGAPVAAPVLNRLALPVAEGWAIVTLQLATARGSLR